MREDDFKYISVLMAARLTKQFIFPPRFESKVLFDLRLNLRHLEKLKTITEAVLFKWC